MVYHYTDSGLDNVWLEDGYTIENDPDYGEIFTVEQAQDLHRFLGRLLVALPRPLNGAEFRFLRKELDLSQRTLATFLGSNEQSVAKWEKARTKPVGNKTAERMLRLLYAQSVDGNPDVQALLTAISDLDAQLCEIKLDLSLQNHEWARAA